ncbi:MAG: pyridoxamine 5'-phosphate oxidase family protein [Desulfatiglandaceae bacterium]|jgi:nitroimidazol reductase NimA-like FMN-containing flavoprotein (pyridoxamine 5'-phosphate oxidase superfamily)
MRRREKEIPDKTEVEGIIRKSLVCRLALSRNNFPYIVPLCFGYEENALYFHMAREGEKLDILMKNRNVCFEFDADHEIVRGENACKWGMKYRSVIGFGTVSFLEDSESKRHALDTIMGQYSEGTFAFPKEVLEKTVVIKVDITRMTGKKSGYDRG